MPTPTPTPDTTPSVETPVEPKAGEVDDLGYTTPEDVTPAVEEVKPDEEKPKPTEELPSEEDSTGYGKEDEVEKPEDKPAEKTAEELAKEKEDEENKTDEEKAAELVQANIKKHIEGLPESVNKDAVSKFAEENGLTDVQVEAYVKLAKADDASLVTQRENAIKEQRKAWKGELQGDPEFGGENFDKNVDRVNKVLDKYMPDTKKILTERGTMLPPYIMRDFLKLDKVLNPTTKLPTGEPPAVKKEEVSLLDEMYS
jgi:hypothetical protein